MSRSFTLAAAQYPLDRLTSWQAYKAKIVSWIESAAREGAQLLVFPEYGGMELASLFGREVERCPGKQLPAVASLEAEVAGLHGDLARRHGVHILVASQPVRAGDRFHNRARLVGPDGCGGWQDKITPTACEREGWGVSGAVGSSLFDTALGRIGVAIGDDVGSAPIARALAGAELILAPSCTDTAHDHHRVRLGAQARALENACPVVQSPTVGAAPWSQAVSVNVGTAGVYAPPDAGFCEDGVLAQGRPERAMWLFAELDLERMAELRAWGRALHDRGRPERGGSGPAVTVGLL